MRKVNKNFRCLNPLITFKKKTLLDIYKINKKWFVVVNITYMSYT